MKLVDIKDQTRAILLDILERSAIRPGQIFVLGLSSSEVAGGVIGKSSSAEIGYAIVQTILDELKPRGIHLAVQGCEHLNRALAVERQWLQSWFKGTPVRIEQRSESAFSIEVPRDFCFDAGRSAVKPKCRRRRRLSAPRPSAGRRCGSARRPPSS